MPDVGDTKKVNGNPFIYAKCIHCNYERWIHKYYYKDNKDKRCIKCCITKNGKTVQAAEFALAGYEMARNKQRLLRLRRKMAKENAKCHL